MLDGTQNCVQCSQANRLVIRNRDAVMLGPITLNHDVTADLMDLVVADVPT